MTEGMTEEVAPPFNRVFACDNAAEKHLLYGNGFAMAFSKRFGYSALRGPIIARLQGAARTALEQNPDLIDVEKMFTLIDQLADELAAAVGNGDVDGVEAIKAATDAADELRRQLPRAFVDEILDVHMSLKAQVERDPCLARSAARFLANFEQIFTLNYDLVWLIVRELAAGSFHDPVYVHGGIHLLTGQTSGLQEPGGSQIDKIIDVLSPEAYATTSKEIEKKMQAEKGDCPALVMAADGRGKKEQMDKLAASYQPPKQATPLEDIRNLRGSLYLFGWSASDSDGHLVEAIGAAKGLTGLNIGIYSSSSWSAVTRMVAQVVRMRCENNIGALKVNFFDSKTCF